MGMGGKIYATPSKISGSWNVRVKPENGKTAININITNLSAITNYSPPTSGFKLGGETNLECKSTGVFEAQIAEMIK